MRVSGPSLDDAFYQGKAVLLVEDPLTARVLSKCWSGHPKAKDLVLRPAGGREGVSKLVQASREEGRSNVFGLRDADFNPKTHPLGGEGGVYVTQRHEFENHLLDWATLAKLSRGSHTATQVEALANREALRSQAWMALRNAKSHVHGMLPSTPPDPTSEQIPDLAAAKAWSGWKDHVDRLGRPTNWSAKDFEAQLVQQDRNYAADLASGRWVESWSGKELLRSLRTTIDNSRRFPTDLEFAFVIAQEWVRAGSTPSYFNELRDALVTAARL